MREMVMFHCCAGVSSSGAVPSVVNFASEDPGSALPFLRTAVETRTRYEMPLGDEPTEDLLPVVATTEVTLVAQHPSQSSTQPPRSLLAKFDTKALR